MHRYRMLCMLVKTKIHQSCGQLIIYVCNYENHILRQIILNFDRCKLLFQLNDHARRRVGNFIPE